jgi:Uma2 family endonuclease
MSSLRLPETFSLEEYFALEQASDRRWEYRDGEIVCMSGASVGHSAIVINASTNLQLRLPGSGCRTFGGDLALYVPAGQPYRYPDVSVICGEPVVRIVGGRQCAENPILIVEVLSPSSANYDLGGKFEEYKSIPTLKEYLAVAQDRPRVTLRSRKDAFNWHETTFQTLDAIIPLKSLNIELPVAALYDGVLA